MAPPSTLDQHVWEPELSHGQLGCFGGLLSRAIENWAGILTGHAAAGFRVCHWEAADCGDGCFS